VDDLDRVFLVREMSYPQFVYLLLIESVLAKVSQKNFFDATGEEVKGTIRDGAGCAEEIDGLLLPQSLCQ
jgi:hypothetical protein